MAFRLVLEAGDEVCIFDLFLYFDPLGNPLFKVRHVCTNSSRETLAFVLGLRREQSDEVSVDQVLGRDLLGSVDVEVDEWDFL